jgi:hypothetical protein
MTTSVPRLRETACWGRAAADPKAPWADRPMHAYPVPPASFGAEAISVCGLPVLTGDTVRRSLADLQRESSPALLCDGCTTQVQRATAEGASVFGDDFAPRAARPRRAVTAPAGPAAQATSAVAQAPSADAADPLGFLDEAVVTGALEVSNTPAADAPPEIVFGDGRDAGVEGEVVEAASCDSAAAADAVQEPSTAGDAVTGAGTVVLAAAGPAAVAAPPAAGIAAPRQRLAVPRDGDPLGVCRWRLSVDSPGGSPVPSVFYIEASRAEFDGLLVWLSARPGDDVFVFEQEAGGHCSTGEVRRAIRWRAEVLDAVSSGRLPDQSLAESGE